MRLLFPLLLLLFVVAPTAWAESAPITELDAQEGELLFVHRIQPLLRNKCLPCHGNDLDDIRGELDLRTHASTVSGGWSEEPALVAGKPDQSPLYLSALREDGDWSPMPPKENDALTDKDLDRLRRWIELGAPWPTEQRAAELQEAFQSQWDAEAGVAVPTSGGLSPDWTNRRYPAEQLWAYQPLRRAPLSEHPTDARAIDALINERMSELGVAPAPRASRRELLRRVTYDLTGLPPTPAETEAFLTDPASDADAFASVVERLLASPHYGERWGQHWLDVTRYADSSGFANDYERGSAWRYRDYVVRAFNNDKPYDQFVREQIAGDEIDPSNPENLVAVGFLRMGPWELSVMEVPRVARQRFLDDATDAIGQVFLGHMLQCARCHDHKFDPIPTRDYYSIQAALATTQPTEREAAFLADENTSGFDEQELVLQRRAFYQRKRRELNEREYAGTMRWYEEQGADASEFLAAYEAAGSVGAARTALKKQGFSEDKLPPQRAGFTPADFGLDRIVSKGFQRIAWRLDRYEPYALSVYNGCTPGVPAINTPWRVPKDLLDGELEATAILAGGDPFSPTIAVRPGVLSAVAGVHDPALANENVLPESTYALSAQDRPDGGELSGRRTKLADWIASPANPLTARVMVNRIWQGHFGRGLAGNPNNFGATGKRPTHPRLLDWLAVRFIDSGWSVKQMHRLVLNTDAYCRSTAHPDPGALAEIAGAADSYAAFRPRRLTAEELRDSMLAVSGELNPEIGGVPVRPLINLEVALQPRMVMGTFAEAWQPSATPAQRSRRSLYMLRLRGLSNPFMDVFNAPSPDLSAERRETSTITPQVFALFNSQGAYLRALAMADRIIAEVGEDRPADAVGLAYRLALGRQPSRDEVDECLRHWRRMATAHQETDLAPLDYPNHVVRDAVEENTGERFQFTEPLEVASILQPDLGPADVPRQTRAFADVCLVLINSNEFAYVY